MAESTINLHQLPNGQTITLVCGDITKQQVGAVVNAANDRLRHGGGVAAIIVQKGGQVINKESRSWIKEHGLVSHKEPAYTSAGDLLAKYVIHAVGPVWGSGDEDHKLEDTITGALTLAEKLSLTSIAFPAISTGIFGFPKKRAARVIYQAFLAYYAAHPHSPITDLRMLVFDDTTTDAFATVWEEVFTP